MRRSCLRIESLLARVLAARLRLTGLLLARLLAARLRLARLLLARRLAAMVIIKFKVQISKFKVIKKFKV